MYFPIKNVPYQLADIGELPESSQEWIFHINAIPNFLLLGLEPLNSFFQSLGLTLIILSDNQRGKSRRLSSPDRWPACIGRF